MLGIAGFERIGCLEMRYLERKPPPELEPFVQCFWYLNRTYNGGVDGEVLWPDGNYEVIFHFGSKYEVNKVPMETAFLIGTLTHYHQLNAEGNVRLFGVRLKPWGLKCLTNIDVKGLKDQFLPLSTIFPKSDVDNLNQELLELGLEEGLELLKNYILGIYKQTEIVDIALIEVLANLYNDPIHQDIKTIVGLSNYSQRQFERKTVELTGLSPKKLSKVARFNQVRLRIYFNPAIDLHDVMTEFGYYDYAHFSKEFKESFGLTPNEYKKWMLEMMNASKKRQKDVVFLHEE